MTTASVKPEPARHSRIGAPAAPAGGLVIHPDDISSPARKMAFFLCLILVFIRFSLIHQSLTKLLGLNIYPLYFFGIPAFLGAVVSGGVQRTLTGRGAAWWCLFAVWNLLATPFSSWRGGSLFFLRNYLKSDFPMILAIAGLVLTWKECRLMLRVLALSALTLILTARFFQQDDTGFGDRFGMQFGTVANPNDFAAHLLLLLPFLLWLAGTLKFVPGRILVGLGALGGLVLVLRTASRGAEIAIAAGALYYFWHASPGRKLALTVFAAVGILALPLVLSQDILLRLRSFSSSVTASQSAESNVEQSALESEASRAYLFRKSIEYSLQFPIFGVGPGRFATYEGTNSILPGRQRGAWQEAHCSYTEVSAEAGLPAFVFFVGGIVITFRLLQRTMREAKLRGDSPDIERTCLYILLGMVCFYVAITFVNFAYFFYEPALAGLAIAVSRAAKHEFALRDLQAAAPRPASPFMSRPALGRFARHA